MSIRACCLVVCALLLARPAAGQTAYPMLMSLKPVAAQCGESSEHTIQSRYSMFGAYRVLVSGTGVRGEIIHPEVTEEQREKPPNLQKMKVRFTVDEDATPGVRDFRIATPAGASTVGQLVIARDPVQYESDKNDTPEQAQEISLPATICGVIERNEDVDYFRFSVESGETLTFHVRAQRLQDRIHDLQQHVDPILTLRDRHGATLAASDNDYYADPFLHHTFARGGEYWLEIRDVRYTGNTYWEYCIEAHGRPFLRNVFPPAMARGQALRVELVGYQLPSKQLFLQSDRSWSVGRQWWSPAAWDQPANPTPLYVDNGPVVLEQARPNDTPEQAQPVSLPLGISGRIEAAGDIDCYAFAAMKGERYSFEVLARRHWSELDSHLRILDDTGRQLVLNDDLTLGKRQSSDSWVENWTAPRDGIYTVEIRDLHLRGGPEFVYFLRTTRARPYFELYLDTDKTQLRPGTHGALFVRAVRKNGFEGEIQLDIEGLPDGVNAHCGRILAGKGQDGAIILETPTSAPLAIANVTVRGRAVERLETGDARPLEAVALPYQETYQPGGGRGHWPVDAHAVAVAEPGDITKITLSTEEVTLKPGESARVDVRLERAAGFDKNVTLDVTFNHLNSVYGNSLPPGVKLDKPNSKTLLTGDTVEGHITLTAAKDAQPAERQLVPVMANVSLNFVMKATYAARPLYVTVAP